MKELKLKASKLGFPKNDYWNAGQQRSLGNVTLRCSILCCHCQYLLVTNVLKSQIWKMDSRYLFFWQEWRRPKPPGVLTLERWSIWELTVFKAQQGYSHSTQTLIDTSRNTHSHTVQRFSREGSLTGGPDEREERRCDSQTSAVSITPQTEETGAVISHSSAGSKANPAPRRGRPRSWRRWPGCTSYVVAGCAGLACLWSQQRSWH